MIAKEIQEKFKAYKKEVCEELGVDENSIRLCDLARQEPLNENGEIKDEIKAKIRERIENVKNAPKNVAKVVKQVEQKTIKEDYSKTPLKKVKVTAIFEVEIPSNVSVENVEKLYSTLAKKHFENCKEIVCQSASS